MDFATLLIGVATARALASLGGGLYEYSLVTAWSQAGVRKWLLIALASHVIMRLWSAFDFIPKALAFEGTDPARITESAARAWVRRSPWRLPLDLVTCGAMLAAFATHT